MIDDIATLVRQLARKHYARWSRFDDAINRLRAVDGEKTGRPTRPMARHSQDTIGIFR